MIIIIIFFFNQYFLILLMFTNIIIVSLLFVPFTPPCRSAHSVQLCSEDKSQRSCFRNAISCCYSGRYARNFIGYSEITVVGNCIWNNNNNSNNKKPHDKLADVSRCALWTLIRTATLGVCHMTTTTTIVKYFTLIHNRSASYE